MVSIVGGSGIVDGIGIVGRFEFVRKFRRGVARQTMGTRMAPSYANLFIGHLEQKFL